MGEMSLLSKVIGKFRREGFSGVYFAVARRVNHILRGMLSKRTKGGNYHILFVNGCTMGESKRYRVYNLIEALSQYGVTAHAVFAEELPFVNPKDYTLVVIFRCDWNAFTEGFVKKCREAHIPTVFDVDDLIFDETIVNEIDAYNRMTDDLQKLYVDGVRRYRAMLENCDFATASTEFLQNYIAHLTNKHTGLIRNGINKAQISVAGNIPKPEHLQRRIGFLSGSQTHQADFAEAASALACVMEKHPDVTLTIIGFLDVPDCLKPYSQRIEMIPFQDFQELLKITAELYAVVVPLEYETVFCQSKSELKYFEQALVNVPVIASPTQVFQDCIQDGVNGFLAKNPQEWEEKLNQLLQSEPLRNQMGHNASQQIRQRYYPDQIGKQAKQVYDRFIREYLRKQMDFRHLKVAFVIPEPFEGAGGHRNIFRAARAFSQKGHEVSVYIHNPTGRFLRGSDVEKFVSKHFFDTGAQFYLGTESIKTCDLLIATQWHTAFVVQQFQHRCLLPCYFIQDFEPYFYPMGEEYVQAYSTYRFGFTPVASGKWAAQMVEKLTNKPCPYFVFPLQREIYKEIPTIKRSECKVIFFARPQMPRRCYMLGVEALRLLNEKFPQATIVFYGADKKEYGDYGFSYEKAGLLANPKKLAELYNEATVGLCFSLTNPSLVPYEMMACGLPVVDVDFNDTSTSYGGYDCACLAEPSPKAICESIIRLLTHPEERELRRENGRRLTMQMPDESEVGEKVLDILIGELRKETEDDRDYKG